MNFGAECGPTNAVQKLARGFDADRSSQREYSVGSGPAQGFRARASGQRRDLPVDSIDGGFASTSFTQQQPMQVPINGFQGADWGAAFLQDKDGAAWAGQFQAGHLQQGIHQQGIHQPGIQQQGIESGGLHQNMQAGIGPYGVQAPRQAMYQGRFQSPMYPQPIHSHVMPSYTPQTQVAGHQEMGWADLFDAVNSEQAVSDNTASVSSVGDAQGIQDDPVTVAETPDPDALAESARRLIHGVRDAEDGNGVSQETRAKFENSEFLRLVRQLRDKEAAIEGDKIVEQIRPVESREEEGRLNGAAPAQWTQPANFCLTGARGANGDYGHPMQRASQHLNGIYGESRMQNASAHWDAQQEMLKQQMQSMSLADRAGFQNPVFQDGAGLQDAYDEFNQVFAEEDAHKEQQSQRRTPRYFQGDGGNVPDDDPWAHMTHRSLQAGGGASTATSADDFNVDERTQEEMFADTQIPGASELWSEFGPLHGSDVIQFDSLSSLFGVPDPAVAMAPASASAPAVSSVPPLTFTAFDHDLLPYDRANLALQESERHLAQHPRAAHASTPSDVQAKLDAVKDSPEDARAWFALGLAYQMQDMDTLALEALDHAVDLDPSQIDVYLAQAVSLGNERRDAEMFKTFGRLVHLLAHSNQEYAAAIDAYQDANGPLSQATFPFDYLQGLLLEVTKVSGSQGEIDRNVQMALGVLLHASKEYPLALDCFLVTLQLSPDDPEQYNRIGASLSNYGHSDLAQRYFEQALSLSGSFVRARNNLASALIKVNDPYAAAAHYVRSLRDVQTLAASGDATGLWDSVSNAVHFTCERTTRFSPEERAHIAEALSRRDLGILEQYFSL